MAGIQEGVDENGDGKIDLKEDKRHIYLEFNNLVTGYGWGVTSKVVSNMEGVTILDREVADSVVKFTSVAAVWYNTGATVAIGDLFAEVADLEAAIDTDNVQVFVSPVSQSSTVGGTYVANTADWTQGTLTFSGIGVAKIVITDYYYCKETVLYVSVVDEDMNVIIETQIEGANSV